MLEMDFVESRISLTSLDPCQHSPFSPPQTYDFLFYDCDTLQ